jgi:hypothetical protein
MWNIGSPPKDMLVALVVRKWRANSNGGLRVSFIASDPSNHLLAFGRIAGEDLPIEPSQTVVMGKLVEDEDDVIVVNEDGDRANFAADAILAWANVPMFSTNQAAAREADLLLGRVKNACG